MAFMGVESVFTHMQSSKHPRVEPRPADQSPASSFSVPRSYGCIFAPLQNGKEGYEKWRVENSWGDDRGNKGKA